MPTIEIRRAVLPEKALMSFSRPLFHGRSLSLARAAGAEQRMARRKTAVKSADRYLKSQFEILLFMIKLLSYYLSAEES